MFNGFHDINARTSQVHDGLIEIPGCDAMILQLEWEWNALIDIYKNSNVDNLCEIGIGCGGSLWCWLNYKELKRILCIDLPHTEENRNHWQSWMPDYIEYKIILEDSSNENTINQVKEYFPNGIDWLFIDGAHEYEGAKLDFVNYGPLVNPGGKIILHDILYTETMPTCGVYQLWQEIREAGYIIQELYQNPNQERCGIGVIYV